MTIRTLSLLELSREGRLLGHLIAEAPDVWVYRAADEAAAALPGWSALLRPPTARANQRAWFRNLLPDAPACAQLARRLGISLGNDFGLLGLCGADCRGALRLQRPGTTGLADAAGAAVALEQLLRWSPVAADSAPPREQLDFDFLLPGEAGQFPCLWQDGEHAEDGPREWVARVGRPGLGGAVENEALCARLAEQLGLPVAPVRYLASPAPVLLIRRHAVGDAAASGIRRLHLEDFNQLSGLHPEQAFEREGGLAVLDCVNLIRRYSAAPALDLRFLLSWLVYAFLAGLGHAHARSLGLLDTSHGPRLVICDGLLSTHVYPARSERMAMYVGREDRPDWIRPARWRELAEELGIGWRYLVELVRQMATRLPALARDTSAELALATTAPSVVPRILRLIENRCRQTLIALAAEGAQAGSDRMPG